MERPIDGHWFIESYTEGLLFHYKVKAVLYQGRTRYQRVDILDLYTFGKTLFLDAKIQSAQVDEFIYHELLVHPALLTHPAPRRVLIAGGGEGATLREVLRDQTVQQATMVDIDGELVELCKRYLPEWSEGAYEDPRTQLVIDDARKAVFEASPRSYDLYISDLTEPLEGGPAALLYTAEFFQKVYEMLDDEGVMVAQAGSAEPLYNDFFAGLFRTLQEVFPVVRAYWGSIFSFQMPWGFILASKGPDPLRLEEREIGQRLEERGIRNLRCYSPKVHTRGIFGIAPYLEDAIRQKGRVFTDENPFVWTA